MRCLSCHEPWASALVQGAKTIETRTWIPRPRELAPGEWLAIHASRAMTRDDQLILRRWRAGTGLLHEIAAMIENNRDHRGSIIGAVKLAAAGKIYSSTELMEEDFARHRVPYYYNAKLSLRAWEFNDFFAIHPVIPWRGQQGLFEVPFEVDPRIVEKGVRKVHGLVPIGQ